MASLEEAVLRLYVPPQADRTAKKNGVVVLEGVHVRHTSATSAGSGKTRMARKSRDLRDFEVKIPKVRQLRM